MTKTQLFIAVIVIILVILGVEIALHHGGSATGGGNLPSSTQVNAVNTCVELCQTVYDESGTGAVSAKEQACENACYTGAGMATSTNPNLK